MSDTIKFPKTRRVIEVTREAVPPTWKGAHATVEEKVDGANVGVWFEGNALRLQSRGHVLRGGPEERQFAAFHGWAATRLTALRKELSDRYVLYGEWCFAKHKSFYDALPDWLLGYDVLDRREGNFLGVAARDRLLAACGVQVVARLWSGAYRDAPAFGSLLGPSRYKTARWRETLLSEGARVGLRNPMDETDDSDWMEGVYIRVDGATGLIGRMKLHRAGYEKVRGDHWRERPLVRNALASVTRA